MGYPVRSLADLSAAAWSFFTSTIPGAMVRLWPNTFRITGKVLALIDFENELRRQWLSRQLFASTADLAWLLRHGWELGLTPDPAQPATGAAAVACTPGLPIPIGIQFQRADGTIFAVSSALTPSGSIATVPLTAAVAAALGNTPAGDTLALLPSVLAPAGLGAIATVGGNGLSGGADAETQEEFRARVLARKRNPPQGGAAADYDEWTRTALPSVLAVWIDQFKNDPGRVWICFIVADPLPSGLRYGRIGSQIGDSLAYWGGGVPSFGEIAAVQAYVADPIRRPVTARVTVVAPVPMPVPVTIANLAPDTTDTRAAIAAELAAAFAENAQAATPNTPFTFYRLWLDGAIDRAAGVDAATLVSPAADLPYATGGQFPVLGPVTFA